MPKTTGIHKSEVQRIRISRELRERCNKAKAKSIYWSERSESEFLAYLISSVNFSWKRRLELYLILPIR